MLINLSLAYLLMGTLTLLSLYLIAQPKNILFWENVFIMLLWPVAVVAMLATGIHTLLQGVPWKRH
jgi:hypothetical protein